MRGTLRRAVALVGAVGVVAVVVAGCGSSSSSSTAEGETTSANSAATEIDVGTMKVPVEGPLHIAYFQAGTNNSYLQAQIGAAEKAVKETPGATMTLFDGKFDATTQFNEIQNAIQSGKYNAAIADALDPALECNALSKQAPEAGIVVSITTLPICKNADKEGDELWTPGTLNFIGGTHTVDYFTEYLEWIVKQNPGPQKVIVLEGPEVSPITTNLNAALKTIEEENPEFEVVGTGVTDYSVPVAQEKMGPLIQANPDATILVSAYSNLTKGAVAALEQAGKLGSLKIYDKGATTWAVQKVKEGVIESTTPEYAKTVSETAVKTLQEAFEGKEVPRFVPNDGAPLPQGASKTGLVILTKKNIGGFVAQSE